VGWHDISVRIHLPRAFRFELELITWVRVVFLALFISPGNGYHRLNPILKYDIPLDDPEQLPALTQVCKCSTEDFFLALISGVLQVAKELDLSSTIQWIRESIYSE